jgi:NADPH2:quinone reductase
MRDMSMLNEPMKELFDMTASGTLTPIVGPAYPLADARRAHEDMRARATTGKVVLDPTADRSA